jgi:AraC family transcriptional regulator
MCPPTLRLVSSPYAPGSRHAPHAHEELQITLVLRGDLYERVGNRLERAAALSAVVKDPGVMHADDFGPVGALTARLSVKRCVFADLVEHSARAQAWRWVHEGIVAAPFLRLVARAVTGERVFAAHDDDVVDLVALLSARRHVSVTGEPPTWLCDAVAQMNEGWYPGLSVRDVARSAGVHPVYLARCLRRWFGAGGADILRRARFRYAARAIADGSQTISAVAHATGFADESHLWREFSKATGVSPAQFRRIGRAFGPASDIIDRPRRGRR